ncbi:MAG: ATP-binding cassette domain-containing protein [Pseudomonadota bacterium]
MALLRFDDIRVEFGADPILESADFALEPGERVCVVGRNGAGKSTTLKLISGALIPDGGEIVRTEGLVVAELPQSLPPATDLSASEYVAEALLELKTLREHFERLSADPAAAGSHELVKIQSELDARGAWDLERRVERTVSELGLPGDTPLKLLSGGWRRRVALARALVLNPDVLLLDEPTNHLDIDTIEWLENKLLAFDGSVVFVTHDRAFLQKLATRIVDIDRGKLISWPGDFKQYLADREQAWREEDEHNAKFDKRLAEEEAWIRQGIKARRTRNEGRVRALHAMRETAEGRRKRAQSARVHIETSDPSGRKAVQLHNVSFGYGDTLLIDKLSLTIQRGDRIGLVGNNGVGKSTLLKLILGELAPQGGTVKHGTNLEIGYFDQLRRELDGNKTIAQVVGEGNDYIMLNGKPRHVVGYLRGFLFSAKRILSPVSALSGGEKNRVVLARLLSRPSNLLVLDEPTNDLDVETLQVLEDQLAGYTGTLLVVSHDRQFLDNVVTSTLVFEQGGNVERFVGNFSDWLRQGRKLAVSDRPVGSRGSESEGRNRVQRRATKLSYKDQRELDALPDAISTIEAEVEKLRSDTARDGFYEQNFEQDVQPVLDQLAAKEAEHERLLTRWTELEDLAQSLRQGD